MLLIAERLCDGSFSVINKDNIRTVLRSLKLQIYIEKWLQIIYRITRICPPTPGSQLIGKLDDLFIEMQRPFDCSKLEARKNFLNYNYVFCRLFQMIGCTQFCPPPAGAGTPDSSSCPYLGSCTTWNTKSAARSLP